MRVKICRFFLYVNTRKINGMWSVYVLTNERMGRSYIGASNNLDRRLRQHRGQIRGGAKCTRGWRDRHLTRTTAFISGFENQNEALRYEWACKHTRTERGKDGCLTERAIHRLLGPLDSPKFAAWLPRLVVHVTG